MIKCATKTVFCGFLRKYGFYYYYYFKFSRIKKYSTFQNTALLTHFMCQRFFNVLLWFVEKPSKRKLFTSRAVMHCYTTSFLWKVCCHFSSHVSNSETTMVFKKREYLLHSFIKHCTRLPFAFVIMHICFHFWEH